MFFVQYAEAKLVKALHYLPEGSGFHSRWYHWNFSFYITLSATIWQSVRHRSGQKWVPELFPGGKGDGFLVLTPSQHSFADCLEFKI